MVRFLKLSDFTGVVAEHSTAGNGCVILSYKFLDQLMFGTALHLDETT